MTWLGLLEHWDLIEADFHDVYGIDLDACRGRSWRWFRAAVLGLLTRPVTYAPDGTRLPTTRLGYRLNPPDFKRKDDAHGAGSR